MSLLPMQTFRKLHFCALAMVALSLPAWADNNGNTTLNVGGRFSFDSGSVVNSGGDVAFDGTNLNLVGTATALNLSTFASGQYATFTQNTISLTCSSGCTSAPITPLATNLLFLIKTNGGNYGKALITTVSASSVTFQYATYGNTTSGGGGGGGPTITSILNNYSFIHAGLPNYGIAQGSIFVIIGSGMSSVTSPTLQSSQGGLPTTLNQVSLSVNVSGTTTTPALYYVFDKAVAAILPHGTPTGTGTLTLNFNGQTAQSPITVVAAAPGLDTLYGTGTGLATVTDANFTVLGLNNPAKPNQAVILWGSGVGGDANDDDKTFPQAQDHLETSNDVAWVGGVKASIGYLGRSQFPGLDQIVITVPPGVLGCFVPVVIQEGNVVSNTVTMAVSVDGSPCKDTDLGYDSSVFTALAGKGTVRSGAIFVSQDSSDGQTFNGAIASFQKYPAGQYGSGSGLVSTGACIVEPPDSAQIFPSTGLAAGTITATTSVGPVVMTAIPGEVGSYTAQLQAGAITASGGTVSFSSTTGTDVGSFQTAITLAGAFAWSNENSVSPIARAQGSTVTWTGGLANSTVEITGSSTTADSNLTVDFICRAPASAGQFTIPPPVLLALPAGSGGLSLFDSTAIQTFTAEGLDYGITFGSIGNSNSHVTYN